MSLALLVLVRVLLTPVPVEEPPSAAVWTSNPPQTEVGWLR